MLKIWTPAEFFENLSLICSRLSNCATSNWVFGTTYVWHQQCLSVATVCASFFIIVFCRLRFLDTAVIYYNSPVVILIVSLNMNCAWYFGLVIFRFIFSHHFTTSIIPAAKIIGSVIASVRQNFKFVSNEPLLGFQPDIQWGFRTALQRTHQLDPTQCIESIYIKCLVL